MGVASVMRTLTPIAYMPITIRPLTVDELPLCVAGAEGFHREFDLPGTVIPAVFVANWTTFFTTCRSTIFSAWRGDDLIGGLGAIVSPDFHDGRLVATEMFWYVRPEARGGMAAVRLLKRFIEWGDTYAEETRLVHMLGGHDESLDRLYRKLGYRPLEVAYVRPSRKGPMDLLIATDTVL